jgi:hypothetical protein
VSRTHGSTMLLLLLEIAKKAVLQNEEIHAKQLNPIYSIFHQTQQVEPSSI